MNTHFLFSMTIVCGTVFASRPALAQIDHVTVNVGWRAIGPVGDLTGQGINNVGLAWEAAHVGWNTQVGFDDSDSAGWTSAIQVIHPNPPTTRYWVDGNETVGSSPAYFRRVFNIIGTPVAGSLDFNVDDDAQIYINGHQVLDDHNDLVTDVVDLSIPVQFLQHGLNLIAVKAQDQQGAQGIAGQLDVQWIPEPSSMALAWMTVACLHGLRRRRRR